MLGFFLQKGDLSFLGVIIIVIAVAVVFVFAFVFGFWIVWRVKRGQGRRWAAAAGELGFVLDPGTFRHFSSLVPDGESVAQPMAGSVDGRAASVTVRREHHPSQLTGMVRGRVTYRTACNIRVCNPKLVGFSISSKKLLDSLIEGPNAFALGYPDFDKNYRVESVNPQAVFSMLARRAPDNIAVAEQFVRYAESDWSISACDTEVFADKRGVVTDAGELRRVLAMLSDLAARVEFGLGQA